jgi:hypothetical protein
MSYTDVVICIGPLPFLETWPPIYRGLERTVRDRLKASQVHHHVYFRYAPCLNDFTFEFIGRPTSPILSPSSRIFVELILFKDRKAYIAHVELQKSFVKLCLLSSFLVLNYTRGKEKTPYKTVKRQLRREITTHLEHLHIYKK